MKRYDTVIIGAGPSGMTAALEIKKLAPQFNILIIEKNAAIGKKLRATGNGRCNITNTAAEGYEETMAFLTELGIATRSYENGLVYPYSEAAADVVAIFEERLAERGVEVALDSEVAEIKGDSPFEVTFNRKVKKSVEKCSVAADTLVLAVGGKAGPTYGTIGDGYRFARQMGHTVVSPIPVLTSVICDNQNCTVLGGNRSRGKAMLYKGGEKVFEETGEIQFTKFGLSGICIFNMTRHMRFSREEGLEKFRIKIDLFADGDIRAFLKKRRATEKQIFDTFGKSASTEDVLRGVLKEAIAKRVLECAEVTTELVSNLTDDDIEAIAEQVHGLEFRPTGISGWKEAQCTSGGVALNEINEETCESLVQPNVYITGELADYDGPCGGYNLTYAWITGMRAGKAIATRG